MIYYTIFEYTEEGIGRYLDFGCALKHTSEILNRNGHSISVSKVSDIVNGRAWSGKVLIIPIEIPDCEAITASLLNDLKLRGQKEAKTLLKQRKQKKL